MKSGEISVRLRPGAGADEVVGERDGALLVRVRAVPERGRANDALCRLLASRLGVGVRSVAVVRGQRSREKRVRVEGMDAAALRAALGMEPR